MIIYYQDNQDCMLAANMVYNHKEEFCDDTSDDILVNYKYSQSDITKLTSKDHTVIILGVGFFKNSKKSISRLETLIENSKKIIWIDGHSNTKDLKESEYADKIKIYYHENMGTSWITHYCLLGGHSNTVVDLVSEFQTRRKPSRAAVNLSLYISSVFSSPIDEVWTTIYKKPDMIDNLLEIGSNIYHFIVQQNMSCIERRTYKRTLDGVRLTVLNSNPKLFLPDVIERYPGPILIWFFDGRVYRYTLYAAKSEIDCLEFSKQYFGYGKMYKTVFVSKNHIL
jgi:hypothetical protein